MGDMINIIRWVFISWALFLLVPIGKLSDLVDKYFFTGQLGLLGWKMVVVKVIIALIILYFFVPAFRGFVNRFFPGSGG
tara:strand:- start:397 stop:633 length:237 start_codon:yes stop_codon:yes gene_type:complete